MRTFILGTGLLAGTIIGAGIFSLPYIFGKLGLLGGLIYLIVFFGVYFFIHLMYARVVEKNFGEHQFFYLTSKYLPKKLSGLAAYAILAELILALTIYLILAPTFAKLVFGGSDLFAIIAFWLISSIFIFVRVKWMSLAEILGVAGILSIVGLVFWFGRGSTLDINTSVNINWSLFFLPLGPLLFSFSGRPAIHEVVELTNLDKETSGSGSLFKIIFWGTFIPAVVYFIFAFSILRLNPDVSPEALNSLGFLPHSVLSLLGIMGLITLWTSYFVIGINVRNIMNLDLHLPRKLSDVLVLLLPIGLYFLGVKNFLGTIDFTGGIFLGLEGVLVVYIWQKCFPDAKWKNLAGALYFVFIAAIVYQILTFF